jgi:tyrosyl-tRNA synthetase
VSQGKDEGFGITIPLLVDHKGNKLGKSEGNAIWLDPKKTSPFDMYQYFLNITDADIENCLLKITFMPEE